MTSDLLKTRPCPFTPYERMRWQQQNCKEDITGYAVCLAADQTQRAAYLTTAGELTNNERQAAVLPKAEASALMTALLTGGWYEKECYGMAFLVPVSEALPLTMCTFNGY
jgi:hypothetical protein